MRSMSVINCADIVDALSKVCRHREELQQLFDTKFSELEFQLAKYKDPGSADLKAKFEQVYIDLDRLITMCDSVDYSKKNSE